MKRNEILTAVQKYFDIDELVCDHTMARFGKNSWQFLDTDFLHALLVIRRDILKKPMYCNGNNLHQRGLRCNLCPLVKEKKRVYLTAHIMGKAGDFTITGMKADAARALIIANKHLLPCPIRLEDGVSWLHFDVRPSGTDEMVTLFTE